MGEGSAPPVFAFTRERVVEKIGLVVALRTMLSERIGGKLRCIV